MRIAVCLAATIVALCSAPSPSRSDEMEQQRCVWSCLANSNGNTDPAYQACVDQFCSEPALAAPAAPTAPGRTFESPAAPSPSGPAGTADRMTITVVQRALVDLGLYPGPVDGVFGGGTAAAVQRFRASRGLATGGIDGELVWMLRNESAAARPSARP